MIEDLSPFSRRLIAISLLLLVIITALNLVAIPLWQWSAETLDDLQSAREREAIIRRVADAPPPPRGEPLPQGIAFVAADRAAALTAMNSQISSVALANQLTVENLGMGAAPDQPFKLVMDFTLSGSEVDIVKMMAALEQGAPKIRLESWSIVSPDAPDAPTKLQARAVAIWSRS